MAEIFLKFYARKVAVNEEKYRFQATVDLLVRLSRALRS